MFKIVAAAVVAAAVSVPLAGMAWADDGGNTPDTSQTPNGSGPGDFGMPPGEAISGAAKLPGSLPQFLQDAGSPYQSPGQVVVARK